MIVGNTILSALMANRTARNIAVRFGAMLFAAFFANASGCLAQQRPDSKKLGDFEILTQGQLDGDADKSVSVKLLLEGKQIYAESYPTIKIPPMQSTLDNQPAKNCKSNLFYETGIGAHCCNDLLLATVCGKNHVATKISLEHTEEVGFVDSDGNGTSELQVYDWFFAYYSISGTDANLSFANSPGLSRLLVFQEQGWRPDHPGEFSEFYKKTLKETEKKWAEAYVSKQPDSESIAGQSIAEAYYTFMINGSETDSLAVLNKKLPDTWQPFSKQIFSDINKASNAFNPVTAITRKEERASGSAER